MGVWGGKLPKTRELVNGMLVFELRALLMSPTTPHGLMGVTRLKGIINILSVLGISAQLPYRGMIMVFTGRLIHYLEPLTSRLLFSFSRLLRAP